MAVVTINYRLWVLGKQLKRARRFWAGSEFATSHKLVVVNINYWLGVLGKKLTHAGGCGLDPEAPATVIFVIAFHIVYRVPGFLCSRLN